MEVKFRMNPTPDSPPLADGLSVQRLYTRVILSISWRNMASWALLPLGMVAASIPVGLFFKLRDLPWNDPIQLLVVVFGIVGLIFSYIVIRRLLNVTRLEITPQRITISHDPCPGAAPPKSPPTRSARSKYAHTNGATKAVWRRTTTSGRCTKKVVKPVSWGGTQRKNKPPKCETKSKEYWTSVRPGIRSRPNLVDPPLTNFPFRPPIT